MTPSSRSPRDARLPADAQRSGAPGFDRAAAFPRYVLLAVAAALLLALGGLLPVLDGATPGYSSGVLLVVLALFPAALAVYFAWRGTLVAAAGVVAAVGALAPGRALVDLQFLADPSVTARPELHLAGNLDTPAPGLGLWALLAGHLCAIVAAVFAVRALSGAAEANGERGRSAGRWPMLATLLAVVAAVGLVMAPFGSTDAYLLSRNAFEGSALVLAGLLLVAVAVPLVTVSVNGGGLPDATRGGLLGLAVAVLAVAVPNVVSGIAVPAAQVGGGAVTATVAALGLAALAIATPGDAVPIDETADSADTAGTARLPATGRLMVATGGLAVLTGIAAVFGALGNTVETGGAATTSPARTWLLVAGVVVALLGAAVSVPSIAAAVRPALAVAWAAVPLTGTAVLDTAIAAGEAGPGWSPGAGVPWTVVALVAAMLTGGCAIVAGVLERDEADLSEPGDAGRLLTPLVMAGVLAVAGFGLPAVAAEDYVAPGLWSDFGIPSWGLLAALLTVLGAAALAARSRPARAAALLGGSALVMALRAAEPLLVGDQLDGAGAATGAWIALAAAVVFGAAAWLAPRSAVAAEPRGE